MTGPRVKGWCPGALRPMESGDGLIVRLKVTGGIVPVGLAVQIAEWSRRWGNGQIDLTGRANLQLRGVTAETLPQVQEAMATAGLLDSNTDGEAVRNVIASPLAGLDPDALLDIRPLVAKLEARLAGDQRLHALPAKFCFAVNDGGRFGLGDVRADIRFEAVATVDGPVFAVSLDGASRAGFCDVDAIADVAAELASEFLTSRAQSGADIRRIRDTRLSLAPTGRGWRAAPDEGAAPFARKSSTGKDVAAQPPHPPASRAPPSPRWGEGLFEAADFVGIGLPFGRIGADDLAVLAICAARHGAAEFRLTPWRTILIPTSSSEAARSLRRALPAGIFILDPADPRRHLAACVGSPSCRNATTDVRHDALSLADWVGDRTLHVSGCAKGCAHPRSAAVTLVGRNGRYDLVRNGASWDEPLATGMTPTEAAERVRRIFEGMPA